MSVSGLTTTIYLSRKTYLHLVNILKTSFYTYRHLQSCITNTFNCLKEIVFLVMQLNVTKLKVCILGGRGSNKEISLFHEVESCLKSTLNQLT